MDQDLQILESSLTYVIVPPVAVHEPVYRVNNEVNWCFWGCQYAGETRRFA